MALTDIDRILLGSGITDYLRITLQDIDWPTSEPPYDDATLPVLTGYEYTVPGEKVVSWEVQRQQSSPISSLSLVLQDDDEHSLVGLFDFNKLIVVERKLLDDEGNDTGWFTVGKFLLSNIPRQLADKPGEWSIEAECPMKMLNRRFWRGKLEPTKIEVAKTDLVKEHIEGTDYYIFYHGTDRYNHTINWCPAPRPLLFKDGTSKSLPLEEGVVEVRYGEGIIRINRQYLDNMWGSDVELDIEYSRYTLWEDQFPPNDDRTVNTPSEVIDTMAKYAGFQDDDPTGLFYISKIDAITFPTTSYSVWESVSGSFSDVTAAANDIDTGSIEFCVASGDALYIGYWAQMFPAVHMVVTTPAVGLTGVWEYWNGQTWETVTPDLDETDGLTQIGQVSWYKQDLSAWAKNKPNTEMPEGYYIRYRATSNPTTAPIVSAIFPGLPLQCMTPRLVYDDDAKPLDILDDIIRNFVPSNYFWYSNEDGNFIAEHTIQQANPTYNLDTLVSVESENSDERIKTHIIYRQRSYERINLALKQNGGFVEQLTPTPGDVPGMGVGGGYGGSYSNQGDELVELNDGSLKTGVVWKMDEDDVPDIPHELLKITLGGVGSAADIYEMYFRTAIVYSQETGGTWTFSSAYPSSGTINNIKDDDEDTYIGIQRGANFVNIDYAAPKNIGRIKLLLEKESGMGIGGDSNLVKIYVKPIQGGWYWLTNVYVSVSDGKVWRTIDIRIDDCYGIAIFDNGRGHKLYEVDIWTYAGGANQAGTWSGNVDNPDNAGDSDEDTYCTIDDEGDYIQIIFDSQVAALDEIDFVGISAGAINMEYKSGGGSTWQQLERIPVISTKDTYYFNTLGLTNVDAVRIYVMETSYLREMSEIKIFTPRNSDYSSQRMRIRYTTTVGGTPVELCDEAADFRASTEGYSIGKSAFGDEIYPAEIYIDIMGWDHNRNTDWYGAALSEIQVWTADIFYGEAKYGTTPPYDAVADLEFAARMGFPTFIAPIDETPGTMETANANALRVLREKARIFDTLEVEGVRPNAKIGDTVRIKTLIYDTLELSDQDFIIEGIAHSNDLQGSIISLVPYI